MTRDTMLKKSFLLISLFLILFSSYLYADSPISVKASINKAFITIGDRVEFRVEIKYSPEIDIIGPISDNKLRFFEIKKTKDIPPRKEGSEVIEGKIFEITSYSLGEYVIDPIKIRFKDSDGKEKEIKTNKLYITVTSIDKNNTTQKDIRGIKNVADIPSQIIKITIYSVVILLIIIVIVLMYLYRTRKDLFHRFKTPRLSPHDEAFQSLNKLQDLGLLARGETKEYYFCMSEIIKKYFFRRFDFNALEQTAPEILKEMNRQPIGEGELELIQEFLGASELVKFAKYSPETAEIQRDYQNARKIIERTLKKEVPETENQSPETRENAEQIK